MTLAAVITTLAACPTLIVAMDTSFLDKMVWAQELDLMSALSPLNNTHNESLPAERRW